MRSLVRRIITWIAFTLVGSILLALATQFFIEVAIDKGVYENAGQRWDGAVSTILAFVTSLPFVLMAVGTAGVTCGLWLDYWLIRKGRKLPPGALLSKSEKDEFIREAERLGKAVALMSGEYQRDYSRAWKEDGIPNNMYGEKAAAVDAAYSDRFLRQYWGDIEILLHSLIPYLDTHELRFWMNTRTHGSAMQEVASRLMKLAAELREERLRLVDAEEVHYLRRAAQRESEQRVNLEAQCQSLEERCKLLEAEISESLENK